MLFVSFVKIGAEKALRFVWAWLKLQPRVYRDTVRCSGSKERLDEVCTASRSTKQAAVLFRVIVYTSRAL